MATAPNTNINIPISPFLNENTGRPNQEWLVWLMNPSVVGITLGYPLQVNNGGTGTNQVPANGELLIGNGTGYETNNLGAGAGISVTNGAGTIDLANTGVLSNIAGPGIAVSSPTGDVTISNTGVLSFSADNTGLTPSTGTAGDVTLGGTLNVPHGGTGATSLTGYVKGSGTSPFTASSTIPNTDITGLGTMSTKNIGVSGTFLSGDAVPKTITVVDGIITSIV